MIRRFILLLLCALPLHAQTMRDDMTPLRVNYDLTVLEDTQTLEVSLTIEDISRSITYVAMPLWTPGSYRPRPFAEKVTDFQVKDIKTGASIKFEKIDPLTWSINTSVARHVKVTYRLKPHRRRFTPINPKEGLKMTGMHYEGPGTFMYVKGQEKKGPVTCRYHLPSGWKVANGMTLGNEEFVRHAKDYDTFVDCPTIVGKFDRVNFNIGETPFSCVFWNAQGKNDWDMKKFANDVVKPIVKEQGRVFGSFPFHRYVFLFTVSPFGGGGLEHLSSTSIGLSDRAMARNVRSGASITAHEFFHTWNVKRIRPFALGPFEYQHENYTGNLWVSEGWTSYYGDLTLARLGLTSEEQYLRGIASGVRREMNKPRRKEHSVFWASRDIWHRGRVEERGSRVDYYTYGELLGLLLDLKIRDVTDNKKSLDDVLTFMNRWFAERDVGFKEDDVERACTAVSNYDFKDFFNRYVTGTVDPPFAEFFALAGLEFKTTILKADFPFLAASNKDGLLVRIARRGARKVGLKSGDIITAIDGKKVTDPTSYLEGAEGGTEVALTVKRGGETMTVALILDKKERTLTSLTKMANPSKKQQTTYKRWMSAH